MVATFPTGSLVRFREREWIVQPSDDAEVLRLRPLQGSDDEACGVFLPYEGHAVEPAEFPRPDPDRVGDFVSLRLVRDAARLTLRSGAGPFRSLGRISFRPRPYQYVPLLMALRLDPVRLLIADDVGVGKTVEAGLIAKELLERGEARRLLVLCPPVLCEQWQRELRDKFHIDAVIVRTSTQRQLERNLPLGSTESVYSYYDHLIVSIDYAKTDRQRALLLAGCPDLVIVDEAHGAARPPSASGRSAQQLRHDLVREIARDRSRHLMLLTATPHSGIRESFASLLGLLDPELEALALQERLSQTDRRRLARHFVQRRRRDVEKWLGEETPFPERKGHEIPYKLGDDYLALFQDVLAFAKERVRQPGLARHHQRMRYWGALALLRSVMSSPAAAIKAFERREGQDAEAEGEEAAASPEEAEALDLLRRREVLDVTAEEAVPDAVPDSAIEDVVRGLGRRDRHRLAEFRRRAEACGTGGTPSCKSSSLRSGRGCGTATIPSSIAGLSRRPGTWPSGCRRRWRRTSRGFGWRPWWGRWRMRSGPPGSRTLPRARGACWWPRTASRRASTCSTPSMP